MSNKYPGGLVTLNPPAQNPALGAATNGVWTMDQALNAETNRSWAMYDPYYNNVVLNLHGNGTNGGQNNTFLDSSSNNFTITRNGNTTQGSFNPYRQNGYWGNYFDGSSSYLQKTSPSNAICDWTTTNFTLEYWIYPTAFGSGANGGSNVMGNANDAGTGEYWTFGPISGGTVRFYYYNGSGVSFTTTTALALNTWSHLAFVNNGGSLTIYINGVSSATASKSGTPQFGSAIAFSIGKCTGSSFTGYLSNIRIAQSAVYTSNFTPSTTPLTAITGTQLLTCQSNRFIDNSSNAVGFTAYGTTSAQAFQPFLQNLPYESSRLGGSGYFDGTGDYLSAGSNAAFAFGTGDFEVDFWFYPAASSQDNFDKYFETGASSGNFVIDQQTTANQITVNDNATVLLSSTSTLTPFSWNYVTVSRLSGTLRIFINGTQVGSVANSTNFTQAGAFIGANASGTQNVTGYFSDFRVVKGSGVSTQTVPTAPLTAITNTQLLLSCTNAAIFDNAAVNDLETVGNAQVSTTQSKYGGASMYFDGNGDYLVSNSATTDLYAFGTGDFTIEMWVYLANTTGTKILYDCRPSTSPTYQPLIYISGANAIYNTNSADRITGTSAMSATTWQHVAVCRSGTSTKLFVNGVQVGSTYSDSNTYTCPANRPWIGAESVSGGTGYMNGYIDDLRVTKGVARYTAAFTPPTSQLQDQ